MNKQRRKQLEAVLTILARLLTESVETRNKALEGLSDTVSELSDEEQDALDNLPENMQFSERADQMQDNVLALGDIQDAIDECIDMDDDEFEEKYNEIEDMINELL